MGTFAKKHVCGVCPDLVAKNQMTISRIESNSLSVRLLVLNPTKEIKTIVTVKHHSDNRDESFLFNNFLEKLGYQDSHATINIQSLPINDSPTGRCSQWRSSWRKTVSSYREKRCWKSTKFGIIKERYVGLSGSMMENSHD